MLVSDEHLLEQFQDSGLSLDQPSLLDKLKDVALDNDLEAEPLANNWIAFSITRGDLPLSLDNLDLFQKHLSLDRFKASAKLISPLQEHVKPRTPLASKNRAETSLFQSYGVESPALPKTPKVEKISTDAATPTAATPERMKTVTPGGVLTSCGSESLLTSVSLPGAEATVQVLSLCKKDQTYQYQKLYEVASVLSDYIESFEETFRSSLGVAELSNPCLPSQECVTVVGRIFTTEERPTRDTLQLQCSLASGGSSVALDLAELERASLFCGQVVALEGTNPTGKTFIVSRLHTPALTPAPLPQLKQPISVLFLSGPFSSSESADFLAEWPKIFETIRELSPTAVVLNGPFVDLCNQNLDSVDVTAVFAQLIDQLRDFAISTKTHLLLVPNSTSDAAHHPVYPTPPFDSTPSQYFHLCPDPAMVSINGVILAISCVDVLRHLAGVELSFGESENRFQRLCSSLLHQRNFYPIYPPEATINLDYPLWEEFAGLSPPPHALLLSSDLTYFAREEQQVNCLLLNAIKLFRGAKSGSFGRLVFSGEGAAAQVLKF